MKAVLLLVVGASLAACNQPTPTTTTAPVAAQTSVAASASTTGAAGIYQGLLPCADCAGLQITLYLYPDSTYEEALLYLGKSAPAAFSAAGRWQQTRDQHLRLTDHNNRPARLYRQTPNGLQQLNLQGQPTVGALAGRYFLSRTGSF